MTASAVVVLAIMAGGAWLWAQEQGGPQPAFGALTAAPPNFVFNTPTTVMFTIPIDTATMNPTTVELQRVDAQGNLLSTVGRMYDNGQSGDDRPGNKTFTAQVSLNEPSVGKAYFRVAAAFRGNQQNSWSTPVAVDVDPFPLPPDPGEAGKQTLEGIDSDGDGVRDDVQRFIAFTYLTSQDTIAATSQLAKGIGTAITSSQSSTESIQALRNAMRAVDCLFYVRPNDADRLARVIEGQMLNTPTRLRAYLAANEYPDESGSPALLLGAERLAACSFAPSGR